MFTCKDQPRSNSFTKQVLVDEDLKRSYRNEILDKFLDEFILPSKAAPERQQKEGTNTDMVTNHALQLLQYFFLLEDFKDAVKEGNGKISCISNCYIILKQMMAIILMQLKC